MKLHDENYIISGADSTFDPHLRWATGTAAPTPGWVPSRAHSLPTAAQLAHYHTPRQRYIARQRCQQYRACPLSHPLPTVTQLSHCHTAYPLPHSLPTATQLAHCHTARQRYIARQQYTACQLLHSSLMVYRSPTATAYQLPQSLPTVHSFPTVTQLANGIQITNCHSLPTATELASHRRACQPPQSLPAATELTSCHRACRAP